MDIPFFILFCALLLPVGYRCLIVWLKVAEHLVKVLATSPGTFTIVPYVSSTGGILGEN